MRPDTAAAPKLKLSVIGRGVTRGSQFPGRRITAGEIAEESQQCHKYFIQYSTFASERLHVRTRGVKLASCPGRHLVTPLSTGFLLQAAMNTLNVLPDHISRAQAFGADRTAVLAFGAVRCLVTFQVRQLVKSLAALVALIVAHAAVHGPDVVRQGTLERERLAALVASERLLARVRAHVRGDRGELAEGLVALRAAVRAQVVVHVRQVLLEAFDPFAAHGTGSQVRAFVNEQHVLGPGAGRREGLGADRARVVPLLAVHRLDVLVAVALGEEVLAAQVALERLLARVAAHVHFQVAGLVVGMVAQLASEGSAPLVHVAYVRVELALPRIGAIAQVAFERPHAGVGRHVVPQQRRLAEALRAHRARVRAHVVVHELLVHVQVAVRRELPAAHVAAMGPGRVGCGRRAPFSGGESVTDLQRARRTLAPLFGSCRRRRGIFWGGGKADVPFRLCFFRDESRA